MSSNLKVNSLVPATGTAIGIGTTGGTIDFRCPATFGGNVTIGGTLTYDEVINIDSIGIVTARSGLKVTGGQLDVGSNIKLGNAGVVTATTFSGSGASLTNLPAGQLTGTVADARISTLTASKLSGALPAISGASLTALNGSNIASGTVAAARIDNLAASKITSGTVATARLGSGTANNSSFLRGDQTWAAVTSTTINSNANNRVITGSATANTLEGEPHLQFNPDSSGDALLTVIAPEGGDAKIRLNADENDDLYDRWELQSAADNHFYVNQMGGGGAYEPRLKFHSQRGNMEPIYDPLGLHGGGVVIAMANTNSGNQSDSPNFKVDFTVPSADINTIKRNGARQGFNVGAGNETGSYISPSGASGILIASCFGNYYWGYATKIYHISIYGSYGNNSDRAVSLNQLHSYSAAGHGSSNAHITLSVQSVPNNQKYTPKLRATFGGDYWSSNFLVVTYVGSGVASYANLRSLSHINSEITGQDTAWK